MHQEGLFEADAESYQRLEQVAIELSDACADGEKIRVNKANAKILDSPADWCKILGELWDLW